VQLVAITDRARMRPGFGEAIARMLARFPGAIVQVREKDLDGGPLLALVREALATGARVLVNDRVDVALAAGAHGVHLPERGLALADARALLPPGALVGVSRHDLAGVAAAAAAGADLIQLGPIWPSPGKSAPLGTGALRDARDAIEPRRDSAALLAGSESRLALTGRAQLVAVGGIDCEARARDALAAGADAVAAIRWAWD
jgi:thiamine-phosphate pyrophosphorylase